MESRNVIKSMAAVVQLLLLLPLLKYFEIIFLMDYIYNGNWAHLPERKCMGEYTKKWINKQTTNDKKIHRVKSVSNTTKNMMMVSCLFEYVSEK